MAYSLFFSTYSSLVVSLFLFFLYEIFYNFSNRDCYIISVLNILKIIMNLLVLRSFVSRSKTLLKRRKINVKKRTVSKKTLKEEKMRYSYGHQYKILQLTKELDRRSYPNTHVNELMEEIFYPDIAY